MIGNYSDLKIENIEKYIKKYQENYNKNIDEWINNYYTYVDLKEIIEPIL